MKKTISMAALLLLIAGTRQQALADFDQYNLELELQGRHTVQDSATYGPYEDTGDIMGSFGAAAFRETYFIEVVGNNVAYDDQYYHVAGGIYGLFNYKVYLNQIPHFISDGSLSFYESVGTSRLAYDVADAAAGAAYTPEISLDAETDWNEFDYAIQRTAMGYELNFTSLAPFYMKTATEKLYTKGLRPMGMASGVYADKVGVQGSGFGNMVEMPELVNYETINATFEGGYQTRTFHAALAGVLSNFTNDNQYLTWRNPYVTTQTFEEVTGLPPDNKYYKIGGEIGWKGLPLKSNITAQLNRAILSADFLIRDTMPDADNGTPATNPTYFTRSILLSRNKFEGELAYTKAGFRIVSQPTHELSSSLFYSYLSKDNNSTRITFQSGNAAPVSTSLFGYDKNNAGIDLGYRLPMQTKLKGGFEWLDINRDEERDDALSTTDKTLSLGIENSALDMVTAKAGYKKVWTSSEFANGNAGTQDTDASYVLRYLRRFDATDKDKNVFTLGVDIFPAAFVDLGIEYIFTNVDYDETILGRTDDKSHNFSADAVFRLPLDITFDLRGGYENSENNSFHRNFPPGTAGRSANPGAGTQGTGNTSAYNWTGEEHDDYWTGGGTLTVPLMNKRLNLVAEYEYQKAAGEVLLSRPDGIDIADITQSDDYVKKYFGLKATFAWTENIDTTIGFAYERFNVDDLQYFDYQYATGGAEINSLLTGAFTDNHYEESLGFIKVAFHYGD